MSIPMLSWVTRSAYWEADLKDGTTLRIFALDDPVEYQLLRWGSLANPVEVTLMGTFATLADAQQSAADWVGDT